jgi:hypothetical protein
MARINVPDGEGLEAHRMWKLAPHMGAGMSACALLNSINASFD